MNSENFDALVQSLRSLRVSPDFTQGLFFMLGGVLLHIRPGDPPEGIPRPLQWVLPHDMNAVSEDILSRMHDGQIAHVIEEFFYRMNVEIPLREIRIKDYVTQLFKPADHGLLPRIDPRVAGMCPLSRLYFAMLEEIGRRLKPSHYSDAEAYLAGICFFSSWAQIDIKATGAILRSLDRSAPPVSKFFFALPRLPGAPPLGWLPTQMAFWGLIAGLDERCTQVAWPYQSWILFRDGDPRPGVEDLTPTDFFDHCKEISISFFAENKRQIRQIARIGVEIDEVPAWSEAMSQSDVFMFIENRWDYNPADESLSEIERKQVNACIIFTLFCSLYRASTLN